MNLTQALDCYFLNLKENSKRLTSVEAVDPICHDQLGQRKVRLIDLCVPIRVSVFNFPSSRRANWRNQLTTVIHFILKQTKLIC